LLPATVAGFVIARLNLHRLSAGRVRAGSLLLCAAAGIYALVCSLI
jgi:hypothetical protein